VKGISYLGYLILPNWIIIYCGLVANVQYSKLEIFKIYCSIRCNFTKNSV
jgi:hypothetical protein